MLPLLRPDAVGDGLDELRRGGVIAHRAHHADRRRKGRQADELVEPAVGHHRVVVEEDQVLPLGPVNGLLDGVRNAEIGGGADDLHPRPCGRGYPGEVLHRAVEGADVDEDQFERLPAMAQQAGHTELGVFQLPAAGHEDRDETAENGNLFVRNGGKLLGSIGDFVVGHIMLLRVRTACIDRPVG